MAKLIIKKRNGETAEINLDPSKEWMAGRKLDADILLEDSKGISREHFKLYCTDGVWNIEVLSKLGNVMADDKAIETALLHSGFKFFLPPYEFEFVQEEVVEQSSSQFASTDASFGDRTIVHQVEMAAYVKILDGDGETLQKIRLEGGDTWTAGRDTGAQILISDHRVSRRQFEIRKTSIGYEIIDLGSVNGTYVNEKILEADEGILLKSGDSIRVLNHNLIFEILDLNFFDRIEKLPALAEEPTPMAEPQPLMETVDFVQEPTPEPEPQVDPKAERTKKIRIMIAIIAVVGVIAYLAGNNENEEKLSNVAPSGSDPLATLNPKQRTEYKQSLELAKRYHMEGNYNLAVSETDELVKKFNLKDPELDRVRNTALAAIESQKMLIRQEKEEKERQAMEAKIVSVADHCGKQLSRFNSEEQMETCMVDALQLDPQHHLIVNLRAKMQALLAERAAKRQQQADYNRRVGLLRSYYEEAKQLEKQNEYIRTIAAYEKVMDSSLPDPGNLKAKSKSDLSRLKTNMANKIKQFETTAKDQNEKKQYKQAVLTLRSAVKIDPTRSDLKDRADEIKNELRKQMMIYYQEGVLEESFGNVEGGDNRPGAKEKWKKIIELDLPDGEYYQKAYIKLKKYGA